MLKRWFLVGGILVLVSLLLFGCIGVPTEEHEAVVAERDSTLAELQSVKSQLNSAQAEVSDLEVEVSDLEGKASDLSSELEEKQQQLGDVQRIVDSLAPKVQMQQLLGEFSNKRGRTLLENPTLTHSEWRRFVMDEFRMDMAKYLEAVDDYALRVGYEKAIIWEVDGWHIHLEEFDKLLTFLSELIEVDINELQAALAD